MFGSPISYLTGAIRTEQDISLFILLVLIGQEEESTMEPPPADPRWGADAAGNDDPFHTEESLKGVGYVPKALKNHPLVINNKEECNVIRL